MSGLSRHLQVAKITWKSMLAYQTDTWLGAAMSGFRVLLAFLLWQAIFTGRAEVGGYTLPVMITYSLLASLLGRLQHQDALAWQLSGEVREGIFSKYLVHPMSVTGYFLGAGFGRWSYLLFVNGAALGVWSLVFSGWLVPPSGTQWLWILLLLPLGALCILLLNHALALLSLKYLDTSGMMMVKNIFMEFFSGTLLPLHLLPAPLTALLKYTPFYYVVYYPVSLYLGKAAEPPIFAVLVLLAWCVIFFAAGEAWYRHARKYYEGVGV